MKNILYGFTACLLAMLCVVSTNVNAQQTDGDIPAAQLLQPAELVQILNSSAGEKPLILQVGSHVLYAEAHISGSEYVGAGGQDSGRQVLRDRVKSLKRDQFIVLYCGCCPWGKCPNIRPAYHALTSLGFTRVRVLYLADNFGTNWVAKGYPVAKGR